MIIKPFGIFLNFKLKNQLNAIQIEKPTGQNKIIMEVDLSDTDI